MWKLYLNNSTQFSYLVVLIIMYFLNSLLLFCVFLCYKFLGWLYYLNNNKCVHSIFIKFFEVGEIHQLINNQ